MTLFKILYMNGEGVAFHNYNDSDINPEDYVANLIKELDDDPNEVEAYLIGVPEHNLSEPWFAECIHIRVEGE